MTRILIVEDEPDIALGLGDDLTVEGYAVEIVADGDAAVRRGREAGWDAIVLDVMLPKKDGFDVCRDLRRGGVRTPIILLTARTQEAEKVLGLELGADDYVTKPFSPRELRARLKAVMRRHGADDAPAEIQRFGEMEVDFGRAEVRRQGRVVDLTPLEFRLLEVFVRRRGRALSRDQLLDAAWGADVHVTDRAVDAHIVNLRRKIEPQSAGGHEGYFWMDATDATRGRPEIATIDLSTGTETARVPVPRDPDAAFAPTGALVSPDGRRLAIRSVNAGTRDVRLAVATLGGTDYRVLHTAPPRDIGATGIRTGSVVAIAGGSLRWSSDNHVLYFLEPLPNGLARVRLMQINVEGGVPEFSGFTPTQWFNLNPGESRVAYWEDESSHEVWALDVSGLIGG